MIYLLKKLNNYSFSHYFFRFIEQNWSLTCLLYVFFIVLDIRLIKEIVPACDK